MRRGARWSVPDRVARLFVNLTRKDLRPTDALRWVRVNGQLGMLVVRDGAPLLLVVVSWRDGRVAEALAIVNPDKLRRSHERWAPGPAGHLAQRRFARSTSGQADPRTGHDHSKEPT